MWASGAGDRNNNGKKKMARNILQVSRSFAAVIRQLPKMLVTDIVVFYLVLRGLDTVEDDMTAFDDIQVSKTYADRVLNLVPNLGFAKCAPIAAKYLQIVAPFCISAGALIRLVL